MKIHEYQAKEIMNEFGVPVSVGQVAKTVEQGLDIARSLFEAGASRLFVKAQVHAGGRGKAGGIVSVSTQEDARAVIKRILGMRLISPQTGPEGRIVGKVLIVDGSRDIKRELYLSIILDRERERPVILASAEGGVEIETLAEFHPEAILKVSIDPCLGLRRFQARNLAVGLGLTGSTAKQAAQTFLNVYRMFIELDCAQIEINPLAVMDDDCICALDAKVTLDESAFYKHPNNASLRDVAEESELEVRAAQYNLNYVKLDGEIGCMVNGAGLAMATMDIIHHYGGTPANFLDVGGGASSEAVTEAFKILLGDKNVKTVLVNIFGGIVRCDRVARGVIAAAKETGMDRPMVVRLSGTNSKQGMEVLKKSGLSLEIADSLDDAAQKVVELARKGRQS